MNGTIGNKTQAVNLIIMASDGLTEELRYFTQLDQHNC